MSENPGNDEHERTRNAQIDELLERDERERIIRDWLGKKWLCFWGILAKLALILSLAAAGVELPGKIIRFFAPEGATPMDRSVPYRPADPSRVTRGH
jgi:hypothetical protein